MATTRPFAFNSGSTITGTEQVGNLAIGIAEQDYSGNPGGVKWWMGPNEDLGYVIAHQTVPPTQPTQIPGVTAGLGFWRSPLLTEQSFLTLCNCIPPRAGQTPFSSATECQNWLAANGYWTSYTAETVSGQFYVVYNAGTIQLVRMNYDGTKDETFNPAVTFNSNIFAFDFEAGGKIVLGGAFTITYSGVSYNRIIRLNNDGSVDTSFNIPGLNGQVNFIGTQSDGSHIVTGAFTTVSGVTANRIVKFNSSWGLADNSGFGTGFNNTVNNSLIISGGLMNDYILAVGNFTSYSTAPTAAATRVISLTPTGPLDETYWFSPNGFNASVSQIKASPNGEYWAIGNFTSFNNTGTFLSKYYERIMSNGYGYAETSGFQTAGSVTNVVVQSDSKPVFSGSFTGFTRSDNTVYASNRILRLTSGATVDTSFKIGSGFNSTVNITQLQSDGKILAGGIFTTFNGISVPKLVRLTTSGSLDKEFNFFSSATNVTRIVLKP